jgi:hypothetical protein
MLGRSGGVSSPGGTTAGLGWTAGALPAGGVTLASSTPGVNTDVSGAVGLAAWGFSGAVCGAACCGLAAAGVVPTLTPLQHASVDQTGHDP